MRYGMDSQLAIFHVPKKGYFATQQMCPHKRAFVLDHGIIGDDVNGNLHVSCPYVPPPRRGTVLMRNQAPQAQLPPGHGRLHERRRVQDSRV